MLNVSFAANTKTLVPFIFTVGIIVLSQFVITFDEIKIFVSFMILIPIHLLYHSYRLPLVFAIILLLISSVALIEDNQPLADQLATYSFWLLLVGFVLLVVKYFRLETYRNHIKTPQFRDV